MEGIFLFPNAPFRYFLLALQYYLASPLTEGKGILVKIPIIEDVWIIFGLTRKLAKSQKSGLGRKVLIGFVYGAGIIFLISFAAYKGGLLTYNPSFIIYPWQAFLSTLAGSSTIIFPAPNIEVIIWSTESFGSIASGLAGGLGWGLGEMTSYLIMRNVDKIKWAPFLLDISQLRKSQEFIDLRDFIDSGRIYLIWLAAFVPTGGFDFVGLISGWLQITWYKYLIAVVSARVLAGALISLAVLWL